MYVSQRKSKCEIKYMGVREMSQRKSNCEIKYTSVREMSQRKNGHEHNVHGCGKE